MAKTTHVTLRSDIPGVIARSEAKAAAIVAKTGIDIEAGAKERAPVDTSNLENSIAWAPTGTYEGEVIVGAEYGLYVEDGTVHPPRHYKTSITDPSRGLAVPVAHYTRGYTIAPQPFLAPAVEDARGPFEAAVGQLYS